MTGSAFADCFFYIDDFTVTPEQLGTEIELCIKADFSARLNAWQLDLTYPEGLTPVSAELGADGYITYLNASGQEKIYTPMFIYNADYTRFMAATMDAGYWYDDNDDLTSYGQIKWEGGSYEEMVILHVQVSPDFQGGEIIMDTNCSCGADARGGTIRENGDYGVTFTRVCHVSGAPEAYACYTPSNTTLTFYYDGMRGSRPGTTYDLNTWYNYPGWISDGTYSSVTRVVFDPSFADARPVSTNSWFNMSALQSISGMEYLNTSEVTIMRDMFNGCSSLTSLNVSSFNTANVDDMFRMFAYCSSLTSLDLSNFNTANVTNMYEMFNYCTALTCLDVSSFNTAKVTNMRYMFSRCSSLTSLDVSSFNTAKVTDMDAMFANCSSLTSLDLSSFNTANVTNMTCMFYDCYTLTSLDLSSFNTANVTNMSWMFNGCQRLTSLDLSNFNTANVTNMSHMFEKNFKVTTIYVGDGWSTAAVTSSADMFKNCTKLVGGAGTTYDANHVDKAYAHIDGGTSNPGYLTGKPKEAYACYTPENTTLTFYYDNLRNTRPGTTYDMNIGNYSPGWYSDGTYSSVTRVVFDSSFADARPTSTAYWFYKMGNLTTITGLANLNTSEVTNMYCMFYGCSSLTSLDLSGFNTANVTDMGSMFNSCSSLTSLDLSSFNTTNVTNMMWMFYGCQSLTSLDLSSFNTAKVTSMYGMFYGCSSLTSLDVSSFNTEKVIYMNYMFHSCSALTSLDLSSFNTAQVTSMHCMFESCWSLTCLDVSSFNTANVTDLGEMFCWCFDLTSLDLSSFNTANVTKMSYMFYGCSALTSIYAGDDWSTVAVTESTNMFTDCTSLRGGAGTTYDANHVDAAYAHIDGGTSNPGYLSRLIRGDVNGDGQVTITDVTVLINYLLSHNATGVNLGAADCNQSGVVNISDVTVLINYLLSKQWSW